MAPPNTPFVYLLWHLYLEPIFALGGTYHLHWAPAEYFTFMPSTSAYHPDSQIAYDQLASAYLFFAFTEGVLMRVVKDRKTWWWIVLGLILCDLGHCYAAWCEMGTRGVLDLGSWSQKDVVTNSLNLLPVLVRAAYLVGLGVPGEGAESRKEIEGRKAPRKASKKA